jgi:hypothetical protein
MIIRKTQTNAIFRGPNRAMLWSPLVPFGERQRLTMGSSQNTVRLSLAYLFDREIKKRSKLRED